MRWEDEGRVLFALEDSDLLRWLGAERDDEQRYIEDERTKRRVGWGHGRRVGISKLSKMKAETRYGSDRPGNGPDGSDSRKRFAVGQVPAVGGYPSISAISIPWR